MFEFKKFSQVNDAKKEDKPTNNLKARKSKQSPSLLAEQKFKNQLMKVARTSSHIVERHIDGTKIVDELVMKKALADYARAITPWARTQSKKLIAETLKRLNSDKAYKKQSKEIGRLLSAEMFEREIDVVAKDLFLEQVGLITSIPLEAGERAQKLALEAVAGGRRADEIALELMNTTKVTESRARLIARTETARTNTALNLARATSVGSEWFIWRNSGDAAVRDAHEKYHGKKLDGMKFRWDSPPTLDDGTTGLPGTFPNCRCYAEAVLDDE